MMSRSRLIVIGVAVLIIGLVTLFPARVAYQWLAPPGVALAGINGSVWRGQALEGELGGLYVRNLEWRMRPLALFVGQLGYRVHADTASGFIEGDVGLSPGGSVSLTELNAALSLQSLQDAVGMPGLTGRVNAQFERLTLEDGVPTTAIGTLEVADLRAPLIDRSSVGGYRAEFFTQDGGVLASVEDTDGVVDLAGSLQIAPDRTYQFLAQVAIKNTTPAHLREQMKYLGTRNERGQYELRLEGRL